VWGRIGRDSSVGIAPRYWLNGPVIESRRGAIFFVLVHTCPASCTVDTGSVTRGWGVNRSWWRLSPTPSSAEVEEGVELYECSFCVLG
jgi:hypothetical protein